LSCSAKGGTKEGLDVTDPTLATTTCPCGAAKFTLWIGNIRITLCDDPDHIALDRDGEGGHFSLREFEAMLHAFISDRL
jgi:hypothetical protein